MHSKRFTYITHQSQQSIKKHNRKFLPKKKSHLFQVPPCSLAKHHSTKIATRFAGNTTLKLPLRLLIHPGVHDSGSTLPTPTIDPCFSSTLHSSLTTITTTSTPATPQLPLAFIAEHMGCVDKTLRLRLSHYAPFLQILCLKA